MVKKSFWSGRFGGQSVQMSDWLFKVISNTATPEILLHRATSMSIVKIKTFSAFTGRGAILTVAAGEDIYVGAMAGSTLRAGESATSFLGMLLYTS